jgi:hypothetical protein
MQGIVIEVGRSKQTGKVERITPVGVVDRVLRFRGSCIEGECANEDIADFRYPPPSTSKFAQKFGEASVPPLNCIPLWKTNMRRRVLQSPVIG